MSELLQPAPSLLLKLAAAVIHADEYISDDGHEFDKAAFDQQLADPEVAEWLEGMVAAGMAPVKRKP